MTATEARYYRASRGCHASWLQTQPQLVIEGVLDETDAGTVGVSAPAASVSSSAAPVGVSPPHLPWSGVALATQRRNTMTDHELAVALRNAEVSGDTDEQVYLENEILGRANVPLDETERGLTDAACAAITAWVRKQGVS